MQVRIWFFLLPTTFGFLFDITTPGPVNGGLTNSHYNALFDIITEERKERKQMEQYIRQLEIEVNKLTNITSKIPIIQKYIDERYHNLTVAFSIAESEIKGVVSGMQYQLTSTRGQVYLTACTDGGYNYNNRAVKFPDFKTSHGVVSVVPFKTRGEFTCDQFGLYLIVASITSHSPNAAYQIRKNGNALVNVRIVPDYSSGPQQQYTGTGSAVDNLNRHDILEIHVVTNSYIYGKYSCLSIIKID